MRKNKRVLLIVLLGVFMAVCSSCGSIGDVSESQIKTDLISREEISNCFNDELVSPSETEISEFTIDKRQTNTEDKEDIIFLNLIIQNDYFKAEMYVQATYNYYDKGGWILDYCDISEKNISPIKAPNKDKVFEKLKNESIIQNIEKIKCFYEGNEYHLSNGTISITDTVLEADTNYSLAKMHYKSTTLDVFGDYRLEFSDGRWNFSESAYDSGLTVTDYTADYKNALGTYSSSSGTLKIIKIDKDEIEYDLKMFGETYSYLASPGHRTDQFSSLEGQFQAKTEYQGVLIPYVYLNYDPINNLWESPTTVNGKKQDALVFKK